MGGDNKPSFGWAEGIVDQAVPKFPDAFRDVTPKNPAWKSRVKFEVEAIVRYLQFLKAKAARPWFQLAPVDNARYNFMIWRGQLLVPERPEIKFNIRILLTSDFPKVPPRCFADIDILNYCGKIYTKNIWKDPDEPEKQFVMICHDHLAQQEAWADNLGIAHFFVREVWFWWAAQQNVIIQEYDKRKDHKAPGCS